MKWIIYLKHFNVYGRILLINMWYHLLLLSFLLIRITLSGYFVRYNLSFK